MPIHIIYAIFDDGMRVEISDQFALEFNPAEDFLLMVFEIQTQTHCNRLVIVACVCRKKLA